jgi:hypothetical protein
LIGAFSWPGGSVFGADGLLFLNMTVAKKQRRLAASNGTTSRAPSLLLARSIVCESKGKSK